MILVNGVESSVVSALDRGLAYGDGVFRTLAARDGEPLQWSRQFAKLAADCVALRLACPPEPLLAAEARRVSHALSRCTVKIMVTRGASARGYRYDAENDATRIVLSTSYPSYPAEHAASGVRVRCCTLRLALQPALAGVKHLNRLENVLARAEWQDSDIAEGLLLDVEERVIGGTMSNLFIGRGGGLVTPALARCGVAGVTRDRVMESAARHGVPCAVEDLMWDDVVRADEVFLVNTLVGVWPIRELDGAVRSAGSLARLAQRWLAEEDK